MSKQQNTKKSDISRGSNLIGVGILLLVISPVLFLVLPQLPFFFDIFCGPDAIGDGCGYANTGIAGYSLYVSSVPFFTGILLILIGLFLKKR